MWTQAEVLALRDMSARLGVDPRNLVKLMCHESGCSPSAHNPGGAVGLIQFEPDTLRDEGWTAGTDAFAKLSVLQQLPYVERYFKARQGAILAAGGGLGPLYVATFLPALIHGSGDMTHVLCATHGPLAWAYAANRDFDPLEKQANGLVERKGYITVGDMINAAEVAYAKSATGQTIVAALDALDAPVAASPVEATLDVPLSGNDS
jgi:hypothetical protein